MKNVTYLENGKHQIKNTENIPNINNSVVMALNPLFETKKIITKTTNKKLP